jgi:uncharacterized protein (DUF1501 family)
MKNLCTPHDHLLSRREWLGTSTLGAASLGASAMLAQPAIAEELRKNDKQVLFIWLDGGISQLESWDPKPNTTFGGPFRAIPTKVPGIHISELLPKTASHMDKLVLVRSLSTQDNSHSAGVDRIQRGDPKNRGVTYPYLGSAVSKLMGPCSSGMPPYVWIKPMSGGFITKDAGFLGPKYGAIAFGDGKAPENLLRPESVSLDADLARNELREKLDKTYRLARRKESSEASSTVFDMAAKLQKRIDLFDQSKIPSKDLERYGITEFGRHMLQARRMLEAGVRFVKVTSYGWDTHGDNFNGHLSLVPKVDMAFSAMLEDLQQRGMLDNVLVILMSEFGRTPRINGHLGRDHWPEAWSLAMAGCGLKKGLASGKTNKLGTAVEGDAHDIGSMFHVWFKALGIDSSETEYDNQGQPLPIANEECKIISEVLA